MVDSRAVVGLGERTLHLAPGAVIMYANGATTEDFRESEVLWWVLLDDYFADFREKNLLRVAWGADHQQYANSTFYSLKASMFAIPATMEAFRVSKVLWWVLLRVHSQSPKKIGVAEVRGSSTGTTITILTP